MKLFINAFLVAKFCLYLSQCLVILLNKDMEALISIYDAIEIELFLYIKLFILFNADDTVIVTKTAENL